MWLKSHLVATCKLSQVSCCRLTEREDHREERWRHQRFYVVCPRLPSAATSHWMSIVAGCRCTLLQKECQQRLSWLMPGLLISKKNLTSQAVMQSPSFRRMQTLQVFRFSYEMCSCILLFYGGINVLGYELYVCSLRGAIKFIFWH